MDFCNFKFNLPFIINKTLKSTHTIFLNSVFHYLAEALTKLKENGKKLILLWEKVLQQFGCNYSK